MSLKQRASYVTVVMLLVITLLIGCLSVFIIRDWETPQKHESSNAFRRSVDDINVRSEFIGRAHYLLKNLPPRGNIPYVFNNDSNKGYKRLPNTFIPFEYNIDLSFDMDDITFTGVTKINLLCTNETKRIMFHSKALNLTKLVLKNEEGAIIPYETLLYTKQVEMYELRLRSLFRTNSNYSLLIEYNAAYSSNLAGIFKSEYKDHRNLKQ